MIKSISLLLVSALTLCLATNAQSKKYPLPADLAEKMLASIPVKEGKIIFEEEIPANPSLKKDELFTRVHKWFAGSFAEDKSTLEINDQQKGLLSGRAAYKYKKASGLVVNSGLVTCALKIIISDEGIKYQLSEFVTNESSNGLTGLASTGIKHSYDLNDVLTEYKNDKKTNLAGRQLNNMNQFVYYVQMSLKDLSK